MKIIKIVKKLILPVSLVLIIFFWKTILFWLIAYNLVISQRDLLALTIIYSVEFFYLLLLYDFIIVKLNDFIGFYIEELGRLAVRKKKTSISLFTIRMDYYLSRFCLFLRVGWLSRDFGERSLVWIGLSKQSLSQIIVNLFRVLTSKLMLLAILSACFSLGYLKQDITYYLPKIQEFLKGISQIKVNIGDIFSRLPALVALITVVPIIFSFYFYSQKREVRKIIDKENSQYFEEVVLLYQKLLIWIDYHIYEISQNFDYVINCQDLIVNLILEKKIRNYSSLQDEYYYKPRRVEEYMFMTLSDVDALQKIVSELSDDKLKRFARIFSVKRFDIWTLYVCDFHSLSTTEKIEMSFYTREGMILRLAKRRTTSYEFTQEQMESAREEEFSSLAWAIYDNLQLLYKLKRASDSLRGYLYSSRTERLLLKTLNKDK